MPNPDLADGYKPRYTIELRTKHGVDLIGLFPTRAKAEQYVEQYRPLLDALDHAGAVWTDVVAYDPEPCAPGELLAILQEMADAYDVELADDNKTPIEQEQN